MSIDYSAPPHPCVFCGHPTAFGSGRFVNRVPATTEVDGEERVGFGCEICVEEIGFHTPAGNLCRECGDDQERDQDHLPFWQEDAVASGKTLTCITCQHVIYDPAWNDSDTP